MTKTPLSTTCPKCGNLDPKNIAGVEVREVYDGVLYWLCGNCEHAFGRNFGDWIRRTQQSADYAAKHNERAGT